MHILDKWNSPILSEFKWNTDINKPKKRRTFAFLLKICNSNVCVCVSEITGKSFFFSEN